jgi:hypothetical protein
MYINILRIIAYMISTKSPLMIAIIICLNIWLLMGISSPVHSISDTHILVDIHHSHENSNIELNFTMFPARLSQFTFHISDEELTPSLLKGYQVLLFYQPYAVLKDSEIEAVISFLEGGGGVIICGDHYLGWQKESLSSYNKVSSRCGITFTSTVVDDPTDKQGCTCTPIIHNLEEHPLTQNISQIVLYSPCHLVVSEGAVPLARGDEDTIMKGHSRLSTGVQGEDIIVAAAGEHGSGRLVAIGSYTILTNSLVNEPDNLLFMETCILWVSEHASSSSGLSQWYIPVAVGVIVIVLVTGVLVFKKNRS